MCPVLSSVPVLLVCLCVMGALTCQGPAKEAQTQSGVCVSLHERLQEDLGHLSLGSPFPHCAAYLAHCDICVAHTDTFVNRVRP